MAGMNDLRSRLNRQMIEFRGGMYGQSVKGFPLNGISDQTQKFIPDFKSVHDPATLLQGMDLFM